MKKEWIKKLAIAGLSVALPFAVCAGVNAFLVNADGSTVYVSTSGKDYYNGTSAMPYRTLSRALEKVEDGGTVVIKDSVAVDGWTAHQKTVTVTGGSLDATSLSSLQIKDNVTFTDIQILVNANEYICANGYTLIMDSGVELSNAIDLYGGGDSTTVAGTHVELYSGTYKCVYGGSLRGVVDGDTHLVVGGTVNAGIDVTNHSGVQYFFGGGYSDTVTGSTHLTFQDSAKAIHLFGGSNDPSSEIGSSTNLIATGGQSMSMYGGSRNVDTSNDVNVTVTGGTFEQIFGGSERAPLTGNVDLRVLGGTITRRIYGGSYNDTSGLSFSSSHVVKGNITLSLGSGAQITYGYNGNDLSVFAHSRYSSNSALETANLVFADKTAYENYESGLLKLKVQDTAAKLFVGSLSVADNLHYYNYTASDNQITQTCAYHTSHTATASVSVENIGLEYTGSPVTPAHIAYDTAWEYDALTPIYQNNVEEGRATCIVQAGGATLVQTFEIRKAPTLYGASARLFTPTGLRFQSKVSSSLVEEGATFGTLVIPLAELGERALTLEIAEATNIPQTVWATQFIQKDMPDFYEEGYAYFNAALSNIPKEHYDKEVVARSYAYVNGVYYYSNELTRSIAQVASLAIQDGESQSVLVEYVDNALAGQTLTMLSAQTVEIGLTQQLTIDGSKGYAAVWTSTDESVVTVDENGVLTGLKEGTAVITAKLGSREFSCTVTVKQGWTDGH